MKAPVGLLSDRTVLRQQDGGASPRQVRVCKYRNPLRPLRVQIPPFVTCGDIFPRPGKVIPLRGSFMGAFRQLQRARPSRDLRNHYAEISEMLKDHDHVIITNHGRGESVLINIEDYAKYEEFLHQRYVAEALAKAKQQAADPDTQWADHESVWETLGKQYDV